MMGADPGGDTFGDHDPDPRVGGPAAS
jgi:hypothetical protein